MQTEHPNTNLKLTKKRKHQDITSSDPLTLTNGASIQEKQEILDDVKVIENSALKSEALEAIDCIERFFTQRANATKGYAADLLSLERMKHQVTSNNTFEQ